MGLDGFSMANLGLHKEVTSAQLASQAEQLANKGLGPKIKDVTQSASNKGVKRKESDSEDDDSKFFKDEFEQEDSEEESEDENKQPSAQLVKVNANESAAKVASTVTSAVKESSLLKDLNEKNSKEYTIRINSSTDMVELYNNKNNKVVETISPDELMELVAKLDSASGIFVNKKI